MTLPGTTVTVFGGTGFLGRRIVDRLAGGGATVRAAVRHPEGLGRRANVTGVRADVLDEASVAAAVAGASAVVNAVSLYVEKGGAAPGFHGVHVDGAARVARLAAHGGVERLVHISGIGADAGSPSRFIGARGRGEEQVRAAFPGATIVRPGVMFGSDDRFFNSLADILSRSPVFPLIGGGTRLQPVAADDVAALVARALDRDAGRGETFELGGPDIVTMHEIVAWLRDVLQLRRAIVPVPLPVARLQARLLELLPSPPLTVAQVELLSRDNVASARAPGFDRLGLQPTSFREAVPAYIGGRYAASARRMR